jgi:hypothetical protein
MGTEQEGLKEPGKRKPVVLPLLQSTIATLKNMGSIPAMGHDSLLVHQEIG